MDAREVGRVARERRLGVEGVLHFGRAAAVAERQLEHAHRLLLDDGVRRPLVDARDALDPLVCRVRRDPSAPQPIKVRDPAFALRTQARHVTKRKIVTAPTCEAKKPQRMSGQPSYLKRVHLSCGI